MAETIQRLLRVNLLNSFGEQDEPRRRRAFAEIWRAEGVLVNAEGRHVGRVEMNQTVHKLLSKFPDFVFIERVVAEGFHGAGRIGWAFGPVGWPSVVTGIDVGEASAGKPRRVFAFVDKN